MDDLISRQAAINCLTATGLKKFDFILDAREKISALPSANSEPKWIAVSERLPNLDDFSGSRVWQKKVLITGYLSFDDKKELFVSEDFARNVIYNSVHDTVVTAWMPLPETYKEESEEKI